LITLHNKLNLTCR